MKPQRHKQQSKRKTNSPLGSIRIIGGQWRGRRLPVVAGDGLRPTTDRVKETVFNWLQFELQGSHVLDLFAGSGGLGLEALSRGAAQVTFAEVNPAAVQQLQKNLVQLNASERALINPKGAVEQLQNTLQGSVDILFLDPPFKQSWLDKVVPLIESNQLLAPSGWVYIELGRSEPLPPLPASWRLHREKSMGEVCSRLFQVSSS